jgi:hypothetical protein
MATRETHPAASATRQPSASLKRKRTASVGWESEVPIVATKSGNADGAKGHRFKPDDMGRHAPDTEPEPRMTRDLWRLTDKLELGAGWVKDPSPVLRGPWGQSPRLLSKTHLSRKLLLGERSRTEWRGLNCPTVGSESQGDIHKTNALSLSSIAKHGIQSKVIRPKQVV